MFLGTLWRERKNLHRADVRAYLGFLYMGYKPERFYWEVIIIIRKIAVVAVTTLAHGRDMSQLRLMLMLGIIWLALVMQVTYTTPWSPAERGSHLETCSNAGHPSPVR